ncbi:hypothetical protein LX15_004789 [Streptoalloteichus tenebrarius]|uniref:Uncharacterized protein n=1 Tax=Streptoalloteichus tenebrarius (strain ATCC 17920 / DSM 40477 / JCM 4838 / CBS 697.72 / NBRC 16177 / NCIMB 11028 / NRRL B-12390 / A12253. 1 / ISP 5477) TaxID=1933 RepID=A0ABT1HZZ0_STRSD|nr:hypothetical protein [Streptoalloteichus tenebrarius]MCP2261069.1 hypothetical protein [Streptoalloteichus tenebrarius]BFF03135.1 hypothetical protein GCM10020241_48100 [Streptoalloteichus tenebrarius]
MTTTDVSARGRANRRRGADAERAVAAWLRGHGWPHAERAVRTGYRTATRTSADPGDITGTPGIVWQIKDVARPDAARWLDETRQQRDAAGADHGILVIRRRGTTDVGRWWTLLTTSDLLRLVHATRPGLLSAPVMMELGDVAALLHAAGYGTTPEAMAG